MESYEKFAEEYRAPMLDFGLDRERDILDKVDCSDLCQGCRYWIKSRLALYDFHYEKIKRKFEK